MAALSPAPSAAGDGDAPLEERVIQAVADITDSNAGLLLTPGERAS
jgi:hypothetical protein